MAYTIVKNCFSDSEKGLKKKSLYISGSNIGAMDAQETKAQKVSIFSAFP